MNQLRTTTTAQADRATLFGRIGSLFDSGLRAYARWTSRQAARHHLEALDDRMLKDIGINRGQIDSAVSSGHRPCICQ